MVIRQTHRDGWCVYDESISMEQCSLRDWESFALVAHGFDTQGDAMVFLYGGHMDLPLVAEDIEISR